jgi:hypothetical protein
VEIAQRASFVDESSYKFAREEKAEGLSSNCDSARTELEM